MIRLWCFIGGCGALGVLLRFWIFQYCETAAGIFPWATLGSNWLGSLLLGIILPLSVKLDLPPWIMQGLTIGFLGGLTTFSSFIGDLCRLWEGGHQSVFVAYACATLLGGGILFLLSCFLAKRCFL